MNYYYSFCILFHQIASVLIEEKTSREILKDDDAVLNKSWQQHSP